MWWELVLSGAIGAVGMHAARFINKWFDGVAMDDSRHGLRHAQGTVTRETCLVCLMEPPKSKPIVVPAPTPSLLQEEPRDVVPSEETTGIPAWGTPSPEKKTTSPEYQALMKRALVAHRPPPTTLGEKAQQLVDELQVECLKREARARAEAAKRTPLSASMGGIITHVARLSDDASAALEKEWREKWSQRTSPEFVAALTPEDPSPVVYVKQKSKSPRFEMDRSSVHGGKWRGEVEFAAQMHSELWQNAERVATELINNYCRKQGFALLPGSIGMGSAVSQDGFTWFKYHFYATDASKARYPL